MEDLEGTYEWGCWSEYIDGAQGTEVGTGYQNTLDIIDANCVLGGYVNSFYTGVNAAQASINYQYDGYSDWYLPSKDELDAIYTNIGPLSGNIGGFYYDSYWGSTQRIHDSGGTIDGWRFWMNNEADGNNGSWDGSCCRCFPLKSPPHPILLILTKSDISFLLQTLKVSIRPLNLLFRRLNAYLNFSYI
jgi:hypothetical protein